MTLAPAMKERKRHEATWGAQEEAHRAIEKFTGRIQRQVLSHHAQQEAAAERIAVNDIRTVLESGAELEPYPDDPRGPSCLFVGCDQRGRWLHVLCGNFDRENLLIITVYEPRPPKWQDAWTRRRSQ
ncbi:MAG: DUF4258 domain-containing protein [Deltaproteobacteria bacterium]|nr:DUF4258 domain-containing protein [Deltaproteobacteria bacterium]